MSISDKLSAYDQYLKNERVYITKNLLSQIPEDSRDFIQKNEKKIWIFYQIALIFQTRYLEYHKNYPQARRNKKRIRKEFLDLFRQNKQVPRSYLDLSKNNPKVLRKMRKWIIKYKYRKVESSLQYAESENLKNYSSDLNNKFFEALHKAKKDLQKVVEEALMEYNKEDIEKYLILYSGIQRIPILEDPTLNKIDKYANKYINNLREEKKDN